MLGADTWLFVLARDPAGAKTRLAGILDPESRARIAIAMLEDVLAAAAATPFARRFVVTESAAVRDTAMRSSAETLDVPLSGTNEAAASALRYAAAHGVERALVLASDLPLLLPTDLEAMLAAADDADIVIAPDRRQRGTNGLLLSPPLAIAPAFGPDSFRVHRERARHARARTRIASSVGVSTDVDDGEDLRLVLGASILGRRTAELLLRTGVAIP